MHQNNQTIRFFNPTAELAIANGLISYQPNSLLKRFESDLAYLPYVLSSNEDLILVDKYENFEHVDLLKSCGFKTPGQILQTDFFKYPPRVVDKNNNFIPWCWAPNIEHKLTKFGYLERTNVRSIESKWTNQRYFYSRAFALDVLNKIKPELDPKITIDNNDSPQIVNSIESVKELLERYKALVLKAPWSSSGRGLIVLKKALLPENIIQRINSILKEQTYLMAEPLLNKKMDFAIQFEAKNESITFAGESYFETDSVGQYQKNYINTYPDKVEQEVILFWESIKNDIINKLTKTLIDKKLYLQHQGFFGVDMLIFTKGDQLKIQPCLEINLRQNMGIVTKKIIDTIHPEAKGTFNIFFEPKLSYETFIDHAFKKPTMADDKLIKGLIPLTSHREKKFGAYIELH
ncbi:MAG: hypothetical protein JXR60_03735 [Bacteroidales bacterium]|nr:hypothetical protein [Bacteroidales bacterium]